MKVVCDRCGVIVDDKAKVNLDMTYPFSIYREEGGDLRITLCLSCARYLRPQVEGLLNG